jgi:hypothetical protein
MAIYLGSKLRVNLVFLDVDDAGVRTPIDLTGVASETVRIWKPDGTELTGQSLTVDDAVAGETHWDAGQGVLDQRGEWKAQGFADGYKSAPVTWNVKASPG